MFSVVDVSKWNGSINWAKVKTAVDGAVLRIGYRGYADGTIVVDNKFFEYYDGCKKNRINWGLYFFTQARNYSEGQAEARWVIDQLRTLDYRPTLPVYIDTENSSGYPKGRADNIGVDERTRAVIGFCETMENAGYFAGVYASTSWFNSKLNDRRIKRFSHWVADYRTDAQGKHYCGYKGGYAMWQYTSRGSVSGIRGNVDLNYAYVDFPKIIIENGLNGFPKTKPTEPYTEPTEPASEPIDIVTPPQAETPTESPTEPLSEGFIHQLVTSILKYLIKVLGG